MPTHTYTFNDLTTSVLVDAMAFEPVRMAGRPGTTLQVAVAPQQLRIRLLDGQGKVLAEQTAAPSAARQARQQQADAVLAGVPFARPAGSTADSANPRGGGLA